MASTTRTVMGNLKTRIAGITVAGGFNYNLNATDQVVISTPKASGPDRVPSVYLRLISVTNALPAGDVNLGAYRRTAVIGFIGFVGSNTDSPSDRTLAAVDLLDDIITRLEGDRMLSSTVFDIVTSGEGFDGAEEDLPGLGVTVGTITVWWRNAAGSGV